MLIKGGDLLYFVHIPRTGGRHIYNIFKKYPIEDNSNPNDRFNGMLKMHLPYPYYKKYNNFKNIKTFTILRNPIDRIISCISHDIAVNHTDINVIKEDIVTYIEKQRNIHSYHNNFFTPQVNFLDENTSIWKFEDGFNDIFCKWVKDRFDLIVKPTEQKVDPLLDNYDKVLLSNNLIDTIKKMYILDMKVWKDL